MQGIFYLFPVFDVSWDSRENRMQGWFLGFWFLIPLWIPCLKFSEKMLPLIHNLSRGYRNLNGSFYGREFVLSEAVSTFRGFMKYMFEIAIDGIKRIFARTKSDELRMVFVSCCFPFQYMFGKECFSPHSEESLGVEVSWMEWPDAHKKSDSDSI